MILKNLYIEKLVAGGYGLARTGSGIVFVTGVLPGETVNGIEYKKTGKTVFVNAEEIVKPSEKRVKPPCEYFGICGGCNWQFMSYETQVGQKKSIFIECLNRIGKMKEFPEIEIFESEPWNYRIRTQIKTKNRKAGFFSLRTNKIVDIENCKILYEPLNRIFENKKIIKKDIKQIKAVFGDKLAMDPVIPGLSFKDAALKVDDYSFLIPGSGFFQNNRFLLKELGTWAGKDISGAFCMDVYGGVGFFSCLLNKCFKKGVLIDNTDGAVKFANKNFIDNGIKHFNAVCSDAGSFLESGKFVKPDCIIIDPPRTGMLKNVRNAICRIKPRFILSISCDPATHSRDIKHLMEDSEYKLKKLALFDLYPQTSHMETAALLETTDIKII